MLISMNYYAVVVDQWFAKKKYCPRLHNMFFLSLCSRLLDGMRNEREGCLAFLLCVEILKRPQCEECIKLKEMTEETLIENN